MNSKFKITIPKPCHENWNTMTPKEKGRFCGSCSKTVIDFTKKSTTQIQDYLIENKNQRVCGHFYKKQLDTITIEIPHVTFQQQLSFQKLFILTLFLVMGTTLFSCQYADGKKQKIENVIIKDSIKIIEENVGLVFPVGDSIKTKVNFCPTKDSIPEIEIMGDLAIEGELKLEKEEEIGFIIIEESPRFKEAKNLSEELAKKDFSERMKEFIQENFEKINYQNLGLKKGKYRIFFLIVIDKEGKISETKVRAPNPKLKEEITIMLKQLPQFISGKQAGIAVKTRYTYPITFLVE